MTKKPEVEISLLSFAETHRWSFGERFMTTLIETDPRLTPDRVGYTETSLEPFMTLDDFKHWWVPDGLPDEYNDVPNSSYSFEWKRRTKLRQSCRLWHGSRNIKGNILPGSVSYSAEWQPEIDFTSLFRKWIDMSEPVLGMLHLFTAPEQIFDPESVLGEWDDFRRNWVQFQHASFGYLLEPEIPNIGWAMVYGGKYAKEVDVDRIRAAGFPVDPIGDGWLVRVTENLSDIADDYNRFSERRAELRNLFRDDLFLIRSEPVSELAPLGRA